MRPYSTDLRERVLEYLERNDDKKTASHLFKVGIATIYRWISQKNEQGHIKPRQREYAYRKLDYKLLAEYMADHPDAFLFEIAQVFSVTEQAIFYALKKLRITRKKRRFSTKSVMTKEEQLSLKH